MKQTSQLDAVNRIKRRNKLALLEGKSCERCGFDDIRALRFHHRDPTTKEFHILGCLTYTMSRLLAEAEKCEILCANCHAIEHAFD